MRFENETPFPAFLFRTAISDRRIAAAIIVRATYDIRDRLTPAQEQVWRVSPTAWTGPQGPMEADAFFDRAGCDVMVFGSARAPAGRAVPELEVSVQVDDFRHRLRVFGDRVWTRNPSGELVPSAPEPFHEMPLDLEHAYGGRSTFDGLDLGFPDNLDGKGFHLEEELAEGRSLPNIEHPDHLVARWDDRPEPTGVGMCPLAFGPRVRRAAIVSKEGRVVGVRDSIRNVAFPEMIVPWVQAGARIRLSGLRPDPIELQLPHDRFVATTRIGGVEHTDPLRIDQVGIEVDHARVFVTYRYTCTYVVRPREVRTSKVQWRPSGSESVGPSRTMRAE